MIEDPSIHTAKCFAVIFTALAELSYLCLLITRFQLDFHSSPKILVSLTTFISISTSVVSPEGLYLLNDPLNRLEGTGLT